MTVEYEFLRIGFCDLSPACRLGVDDHISNHVAAAAILQECGFTRIPASLANGDHSQAPASHRCQDLPLQTQFPLLSEEQAYSSPAGQPRP